MFSGSCWGGGLEERDDLCLKELPNESRGLDLTPNHKFKEAVVKVNAGGVQGGRVGWSAFMRGGISMNRESSRRSPLDQAWEIGKRSPGSDSSGSRSHGDLKLWQRRIRPPSPFRGAGINPVAFSLSWVFFCGQDTSSCVKVCDRGVNEAPSIWPEDWLEKWILGTQKVKGRSWGGRSLGKWLHKLFINSWAYSQAVCGSGSEHRIKNFEKRTETIIQVPDWPPGGTHIGQIW